MRVEELWLGLWRLGHIFLYSRSANAFKILLKFNNSYIQNIIKCICIANPTPFNEWWGCKILPSNKPKEDQEKQFKLDI